MSGFVDNTLVALALIVAAGYAAMTFGPRSLRRRLLGALSGALARAPRFLGLAGLAQRLAVTAAGKASAACGGCDGCGPGEEKTAGSEVRVPVEKIGRRG